MNGSENNDITTKQIAEYQAIQQWRNNIVNSDFIMSYIFIPLSILIFLAYFSIKDISDNMKLALGLIFYFVSAGLLFIWRWYAFHIDTSIQNIYPRICKLEEELSFTFTREYLKEIFFKEEKEESWLPKSEDMKKLLNDPSLTYKRFSTRGNDKLNEIAYAIAIGELLVLIFYLMIQNA